MTQKGSKPKPQKPDCYNSKEKQGYCGPCMWKGFCKNRRKQGSWSGVSWK